MIVRSSRRLIPRDSGLSPAQQSLKEWAVVAKSVVPWKLLVKQAAFPESVVTVKNDDLADSDTPWKCDWCDSRLFYCQAALTTHLYREHGVRRMARRFADGSKCAFCSKDFRNRPRLIRH